MSTANLPVLENKIFELNHIRTFYCFMYHLSDFILLFFLWISKFLLQNFDFWRKLMLPVRLFTACTFNHGRLHIFTLEPLELVTTFLCKTNVNDLVDAGSAYLI